MFEIAVPRESEVAANYYMEDGVSLDHLREGHLKMEKGCTTCISIALQQHPHFRTDGTDESEGGISGDLAGPMPTSWAGKKWLMAVVKNDTKLVFLATLPSKQSLIIMERIKGFRNKLVALWRYHSDGGREFLGHLSSYFFDDGVAQTDTGGYDPAANSAAENAIKSAVKGSKGLLHHSGLQIKLWDEATEHV